MPNLKLYQVIRHPHVTEKTMFQMEKDNKLEVVVRREATKPEPPKESPQRLKRRAALTARKAKSKEEKEKRAKKEKKPDE